MKTFVFSSIFLLSIELIVARPQTPQIDPAYLRDYYAQISQNGNRGSVADATPIFEQNTGFQPSAAQQQISSGQQIRIRDPVQDQIRVQQQPNYAIPNPNVRQYSQQQQQQQQQLQYQPQYQQQNIQYSRPQAPAKQPVAAPRKQQLPLQYQQSNRDPEESEDENEGNSYQFGFDVKDDEYTNYQNRKEVRDGNVIKGSYSVVDSDGFIRTVTYTADPKEGFKADVVREPTDIVVKTPNPAPDTLNGKLNQRPQQHFLPQQHQHQQHQQPQYRPQPNKLRQPIQVESQQPQYQYE